MNESQAQPFGGFLSIKHEYLHNFAEILVRQRFPLRVSAVLELKARKFRYFYIFGAKIDGENRARRHDTSRRSLSDDKRALMEVS
jgi:hypothetical protein